MEMASTAERLSVHYSEVSHRNEVRFENSIRVSTTERGLSAQVVPHNCEVSLIQRYKHTISMGWERCLLL
jgi:hypothetical protein